MASRLDFIDRPAISFNDDHPDLRHLKNMDELLRFAALYIHKDKIVQGNTEHQRSGWTSWNQA